MELIKDDKFINGPVNIIRLEGSIDGVDKILYLFSDFHVLETECSDIENIDVDKFILKMFKKCKKERPNVVYDFFVEEHFGSLEKDKKDYMNGFTAKYEYLSSVRKLFQLLSRKKYIQSGKVNIRTQYTDFRNVIGQGHQSPMSLINNNASNVTLSYVSYATITNITNALRQLIVEIQFAKTLLTFDNKLAKKNGYNEEKDTFNNVVRKIRDIYVNKNVKKIITQLIGKIPVLCDIILDKCNVLIIKLKDLQTFIGNNNERFRDPYTSNFLKKTSNIRIKINELGLDHLNLYAYLVDLYMLRRLLDKSYVKNSIYYCGAYHSVQLTLILVKYFGFKITHLAKHDTPIDIIYNYIVNDKKLDVIDKFIGLMDMLNTTHQCSNMKGFPNYFM